MMSRLLNRDFFVALLVVVFAALVLATAYTYSGISGTFPQLVGWIFLGLALLEVAAQVVATMRPIKVEDRSSATPDPEKVNVIKEIKGFVWLGGLLLGLYLVGFMISTPLYVFAFLRFSGGRSLAMSAGVAAGATAFVYVVFVHLMEYKLFPGILLTG